MIASVIYMEKTILPRNLKFFARYRSENNFVKILKIMTNATKNFDILATSLSVLHNYFDSSTKFFLNLYPAKILDLSNKPVFSL